MRTNNSIALDFKGIDLTGESLVLTGACDVLKKAHLASGFLICCGMLIDGVAGESCVCRYDLAITYTEPDNDDEEPEEICTAHIYACNGYDLTIVNDAITAVAAPDASAIDARVTTLEGVVGDEEDGLVKDVIDLQGDITDLGGIVDVVNDKITIDEITSTGNSIEASKPIIENMTGYSFNESTQTKGVLDYVYTGAVKNGNKLTLVAAITFSKNVGSSGNVVIGSFEIPSAVLANVYPIASTTVSIIPVLAIDYGQAAFPSVNTRCAVNKYTDHNLTFEIELSPLTEEVSYYIRCEITILLSASLTE